MGLPRAEPTLQIDDDHVRVTQWRFAPGAETGEHVHELDYVVVPLVSGRLRIISEKGEETVSELRQGASYARKAGVRHNVINANPFEYAFIEIELKGSER
jgi:beta-alanine degradation protein BauB